MISPRINLSSFTIIRKKSLESFVDWLDQHKQSFYALGWSYLRNQQQMEELFYRTILKVYKELPRYKNETSFETFVTSIFIQSCRELSDDRSLQDLKESDPRQDLFQALDQLKKDEKEALALKYIKGITHEEAAYLFQISAKKTKELLFSGIRSLREEMGFGSQFNGCEKYHNDYIDYLERTLEHSKKIELEIHIYHCQNCQEDLATFQDVMLMIQHLAEKMEDFQVPSDFMENVKVRLADKEKYKQQKKKKHKRIIIVMASVFALIMGIGYFTGTFTYLYYTGTEENQELRAFLRQGLGESLNLEAESNGVIIKIKGAIADDVQTLVFYETVDTEEDNQYMMNVYDGVFVKNENEIMSPVSSSRYYPPELEADVNNEEKNAFQGKISLPPLLKENGTINLTIRNLQKLNRDSSGKVDSIVYENPEYKTGEWSFEIPVNKQPSVEYALDEETEVEGITIRFDKLTIAPTATILHYGISNEQSEKRMETLHFTSLKVNNQIVKADLFGSSFSETQQDMNWSTFQSLFDPLFGEKPKEVGIQFGSIDLTVEDQKTIVLDASQEYPQTFEYAGSTISIDKVEAGRPANVVISNHEIKNRAYESLQFNIVGEGENEINSMEMSTEGVLVDKSGNEYGMNEIPVSYEEIEQPRYYFTVLSMMLRNENIGEKVIPKRMEIYGYNTTKYLDDVVKISVK